MENEDVPDFDFDEAMGGDTPDEEKIAMDVAAKTIVDFYTSFRALGLSRADSAAIVAAIIRGG